MADRDEKLTPEEKLLRVIQGQPPPVVGATKKPIVVTVPSEDMAMDVDKGGSTPRASAVHKPIRVPPEVKPLTRKTHSGSPEGAARPPSVAPPTVGPAATSAVLAPSVAETKQVEAEAAETVVEVSDAAMPPQSSNRVAPTYKKPSIPPLRGRPGHGNVFRYVNWSIVALLVVVVGVTAAQVHMGIQRLDTLPEPQSVRIEPVSLAFDIDLPDKTAVTDLFSERPMFRDVTLSSSAALASATQPGGMGQPTPPAVAWVEYAKTNFKFMGRSKNPKGVMEAIVVDNQAERMHIEAVNVDFIVAGAAVRISRIEPKYIEITDGKSTVTIQ